MRNIVVTAFMLLAMATMSELPAFARYMRTRKM